MSVEKKRVLVVDDDPELLRLVHLLLTRTGVDVMTAEDAHSAKRTLEAQTRLPDLMILDIMLPDISGIDFLRQMRSDGNYDDVPVLILSALIDQEQIRTALDAGADRYLTKPYVAKTLMSVTEEMLHTGRGQHPM